MANSHKIIHDEPWQHARLELLAKEKELTRLRDEVSAQRRALPRRRLKKSYVFEGPNGEISLEGLFGNCSQLLVYHFMLGPGWDAGCPSCSFWADQFEGMIPHLRARDTAFAVVSRAPYAELAKYAQRMGWKFPWFSARDNGFNSEFSVSFTDEQVGRKAKLYNYGTIVPYGNESPGASAFVRDGGEVLHTYSTYARGLDMLNGAYHWLDLTAKGRDEANLPFSMAWVKRHDEYTS